MTGQTWTLCLGARLVYAGDLVEVVEIDGPRVMLRDDRTGQFSAVLVSRLAARAGAGRDPAVGGGVDSAGVALGGLTGAQRAAVADRAGHVREVLTGYRAGHADGAVAGEPRPEYGAARPLKARYRDKADELGVTARTVERWVASYRACGEAGLVDTRTVRGRGSAVDPRWDEAVRLVLAETAGDSTPTRSAVVRLAAQRLEESHGPGVVPCPSTATAYRRLAELSKGTNAVRGSAKGRRSIAGRPKGVYGRLRATRPGEYAILDTQDLDMFAMEPVTCRWVPLQLTVAQDLFSRCILGLRVTPVTTKAVDVAGVLYEAVSPSAAGPDWPPGACWPYHGVPDSLVLTEAGLPPAGPVCPPETLVIDHGKAFLSAHVISVCARLGISIQPAQPRKPTDKPTVERFFKTLREGLIQHLPAYKGPDVHSRGERVEDAAFLFVHEVEDAVREWIALVYHCAKHAGLTVPEWPHLQLSPNEMYEVGVAKAGLLRIPASPELVYDFLQVQPRTVQHYGVEVNGLRYNGAVLDPYRNTESPYGGVHAGKWPIRVNPDDVRCVWFQDPADESWHRLEWEHAPALGTPFSADAARYARRLAAGPRDGRGEAQALADLLGRWDKGMVTGRRERRLAVRLAAERAALPVPGEPADPAAEPPVTVAADEPGATPAGLRVVADVDGEDDEEEEIFDTPDGDDFYADAFEVIE